MPHPSDSSTPVPSDPDRRSSGGAAELAATIRQRAELLGELRQFFDSRGFLEVQPPCLLADCVVDAYLDPVTVDPAALKLGDCADLRAGAFEAEGTGESELAPGLGGPGRLYLQTSPELAMKRMLAAGAPSIYSLGPVFRGGEAGPLHRVEFTMLEWYEVGGDQRSAIALLAELAKLTLARDRVEIRNYRELFVERLGLDPIDATLEELHREVRSIAPQLADSLAADRDGMLDVLLSERMQAQWGHPCPLIVKNYPFSQAALAKRSLEDPECAARFELFVDGVELANGYDELLDPEELVARGRNNNARRVAAGRQPLAVESSLVAAMRGGLPPCAGVALGVDRLQMVKQKACDLRSCGFDGLHPDW